jgi:hypothetical protein
MRAAAAACVLIDRLLNIYGGGKEENKRINTQGRNEKGESRKKVTVREKDGNKSCRIQRVDFYYIARDL